jgi:hypothetical protein
LPGLVKLNGDVFAVRHLAKIRKIGAYDWNSIGARQVRNSAAAGRRRIRHDGNRRTLKKIGQAIFIQITGKLHSRIVGPLLLDGFNIPGSLRMVAAGNYQPGIGQLRRHDLERVDHEFEALIGSPLAERENAMFGIAAPRKVGRFGPGSQNAVRADVNIVAAILFVQNFTVSGHEHRNRIGQQQHSGSDGASHAVSACVTNAGILQVYGVHQMVQGDMGVTASQTREERSKQPGKRDERIASKSAEEQIEPHNVRLQPSNGAQKSNRAEWVIE